MRHSSNLSLKTSLFLHLLARFIYCFTDFLISLNVSIVLDSICQAFQIMAQSLLTLFITNPLLHFSSTLYVILQNFIAWIFGPPQFPSKSFDKELPKRRIAIIGAGLTGVSSAAHCISHGFEVQIFEARGKEKGLGGIWSVSQEGCHIFQAVANGRTARQLYIRIADQQHHVSLPPNRTIQTRISHPARNPRPDRRAVETVRFRGAD